MGSAYRSLLHVIDLLGRSALFDAANKARRETCAKSVISIFMLNAVDSTRTASREAIEERYSLRPTVQRSSENYIGFISLEWKVHYRITFQSIDYLLSHGTR